MSVSGKIGDAYVAAVHRFAKDNAIPLVHFAKGENKEASARPLIETAAKEGWRREGASRTSGRPATDLASSRTHPFRDLVDRCELS